MFKKICVELNAANPQIPFEACCPYFGSAASFTILNVPRPLGKRTVSAVYVELTNVAGVTRSFAAERVGSAWGATVPASAVGDSGVVTGGVCVWASGTDDAGATVDCWILGTGDLRVLSRDGTIAPGVVRHNVHGYAAKPENPHDFDLAPASDAEGAPLELYFNGAWRQLGGGSTAPHASTHGVGGTDPVTVAQSQVTGLDAALAAKRGKDDLVYGDFTTTDAPPNFEIIGFGGNYWVASGGGGGWHAAGDKNATRLEWVYEESYSEYHPVSVRDALALKSQLSDKLDSSDVVAPSQDAAQGKAADAKATGDALKDKADEYSAEWVTEGLPSGVTVTGGPYYEPADDQWYLLTSDGIFAKDGIGSDPKRIEWVPGDEQTYNPVSYRPRVLRTGEALAPGLDDDGVPIDPNVRDLFSEYNTLTRYKMVDVVGNALAVQTFNRLAVTDATAHDLSFPAVASGRSRDFALRLEIGAGSYTPAVTFPSATYEGDDFPDITPDATNAKAWILAFTETKANTWLVRVAELKTPTTPPPVAANS